MPNQLDVLTQIAHKSDKLAGNASFTANGFRALMDLQVCF